MLGGESKIHARSVPVRLNTSSIYISVWLRYGPCIPMNRIRTLIVASGALLAIFPAALAQAPADLSPWLQTLSPRNIGPTTMGGRISDIAVYEKEPRIFYVASASGGLFRTDNSG